jgi:hypothetical protein
LEYSSDVRQCRTNLAACAVVLAIMLMASVVAAQTNIQGTRAASRQVDLGRIVDAQIVRPQGPATAVSPAAKMLAIRSGEYIVGRWSSLKEAVAPTMPGGQAWPVEYGFIGVTAEGREVRFRPVLETSGGLQLSGDASVFKGIFYVGLKDLGNSAAKYDLPHPIALLVSAQADDVNPRQFQIGHTNLPFTEISVLVRNPGDLLNVTVQASGTDERATISIPIVRPGLDVLVARARIQGFGLETSEITVRAVGVSNPSGRVVAVTSNVASVQPTRVTLDAQGTGATTLRSVSIGTASVTASSPPLVPATGTITMSWPVEFLVAAVFGAIVGALLKRGRRRTRKRNSLLPAIAVGILAGLVAVVLFAVGVNVLPVKPTATAGEALTFALSAVGAYVGLRL